MTKRIKKRSIHDNSIIIKNFSVQTDRDLKVNKSYIIVWNHVKKKATTYLLIEVTISAYVKVAVNSGGLSRVSTCPMASEPLSEWDPE